MTSPIAYDAVMPTDFATIAKDFDFNSARLGKVDFPDDFVKDYIALFTRDDDILQSDKGYAPVSLGAGPLGVTDIFSPGDIFVINNLLNESIYAEEGAVILPPGLYAVAELQDAIGRVYLMINLDAVSADYGGMFLWRKAHDALGTGDNAQPPVKVAGNLGEFLDSLITFEEASSAGS